jgi:para-nitrobenzyl esterase
MIDYWTSFAKTGNPNSSRPAQPNWPAYTPAGDTVMHLNLPASKASSGYADEHSCPFWQPILTYKS